MGDSLSLSALFQDVRRRMLGTDHDKGPNSQCFYSLPYTRQRPLVTIRLDASDIELDEANFIGHAAQASIETSVTKALNASSIG